MIYVTSMVYGVGVAASRISEQDRVICVDDAPALSEIGDYYLQTIYKHSCMGADRASERRKVSRISRRDLHKSSRP